MRQLRRSYCRGNTFYYQLKGQRNKNIKACGEELLNDNGERIPDFWYRKQTKRMEEGARKFQEEIERIVKDSWNGSLMETKWTTI